MVIVLLWIVLENYIFKDQPAGNFPMTPCHMRSQVICPDSLFAYDTGYDAVSYTHLTLPTIA